MSITTSTSAPGGAEFERMFGLPRLLLRDGAPWATNTFTHLGTHSRTQVDTPSHDNSPLQGYPPSIDQLPLEWFFAPGVVFDFRHKADGDALTAEEVQAEPGRIGHVLKERDIPHRT